MRRWIATLFLATLALYLGLPTRNYYWDGVAFALHIEHPDWFGASMVHPNHLFYTPAGWVLYTAVNAIGIPLGALRGLQMLSAVAGAAGVAMVTWAVWRMTRDRALAIWLGLALAFSATWWKFSTDASAYVPCAALLLAAFFALLRNGPWAPVEAALWHAAAMLTHELAVWFTPAAILALHMRGRSAGVYAGAAGCVTAAAYGAAFVAKFGRWNSGEFWRWITYHSPDSAFTFEPVRSLLLSLRGHVRLLFGGKLGEVEWPALFCAAVVGAAAVALWRLPEQPKWTPDSRVRVACLAWAGCFAVFLFFWLPQNTFYRLLYAPALCLLAASVLRWTPGRRNAALLAAMAAWNFGFFIYPATRASNNPPLTFAQKMREELPPGSIVYLGDFHADAWLMWYLNPQVICKQLPVAELADAERELPVIASRGGKAWAETSLIAKLEADPAGAAWLARHTRPEKERRLRWGAGEIRYMQLFP